MNTKYLKEDEELEKNLARYVDDVRNFQSIHYKNPKKNQNLKCFSINSLKTMNHSELLSYIYQKKKMSVKREYRRKYYFYLKALSKNELISIALQFNSKNIEKNSNDLTIKTKIFRRLNLS